MELSPDHYEAGGHGADGAPPDGVYCSSLEDGEIVLDSSVDHAQNYRGILAAQLQLRDAEIESLRAVVEEQREILKVLAAIDVARERAIVEDLQEAKAAKRGHHGMQEAVRVAEERADAALKQSERYGDWSAAALQSQIACQEALQSSREEARACNTAMKMSFEVLKSVVSHAQSRLMMTLCGGESATTLDPEYECSVFISTIASASASTSTSPPLSLSIHAAVLSFKDGFVELRMIESESDVVLIKAPITQSGLKLCVGGSVSSDSDCRVPVPVPIPIPGSLTLSLAEESSMCLCLFKSAFPREIVSAFRECREAWRLKGVVELAIATGSVVGEQGVTGGRDESTPITTTEAAKPAPLSVMLNLNLGDGNRGRDRDREQEYVPALLVCSDGYMKLNYRKGEGEGEGERECSTMLKLSDVQQVSISDLWTSVKLVPYQQQMHADADADASANTYLHKKIVLVVDSGPQSSGSKMPLGTRLVVHPREGEGQGRDRECVSIACLDVAKLAKLIQIQRLIK